MSFTNIDKSKYELWFKSKILLIKIKPILTYLLSFIYQNKNLIIRERT